ncbi:Endonuclease [Aphelenchoides fujianensis]|nr:Endonuclease [Aphelenchoides fujianensis]
MKFQPIDRLLMTRFLLVAAASGASFLLGLQWSEMRRPEPCVLVRDARAATALVAPPPGPPVARGRSDGQTVAFRGATAVEGERDHEVSSAIRAFDNLRVFSDFVVSYDRRTRTAHWVLEHLTPECLAYDENIERSKSVFKPDESIHPYFRSLNEDYRGSGFDRGHLAPAGNHRRSQLAMDQTFYLTNMSPQVGKGFNRDKWNDLERYVRKMARSSKNTYVATGPLYLPRVEPDGKSYVRYQVALVETAAGFELHSWILPNAVGDRFSTCRWTRLSDPAGLLLFEKFPKEQLARINGKKAGGGGFFS